MFQRNLVVSSGFIALVALSLAACENNRSSNNEARGTEPQSNANPQPQGAVTNTNAQVPASGDVLAKAANRDRVKEPTDEAKIVPAKSVKLPEGFAIPVRFAPRGEWIASLSTAGPVNAVARDSTGDYFLVLYPDPNDSSKEFAGWVFKDAIENTSWTTQDTSTNANKPGAPATGGKSTLTCGKGESHMKTDHEFCAKPCRDDAACGGANAKGETCDGLAFEVREGASKLEPARYCISSGSAGTNRSM